MSMSISKRRSPLQIVVDILSVAREGAKITQIVYKANLNFKRATNYLEVLMKKGLISAVQNPPGSGKLIYRTTEKGRQFLMQFKQLERMLTAEVSVGEGAPLRRRF